MSRFAQGDAIKKFAPIKLERDRVRAKRGIRYVSDDEAGDFSKMISDLRTAYSTPPAPAMPIYNLVGKAGRKARKRANQASAAKAMEPQNDEHNASSASRHRENTVASGEVSQLWIALVHTPISI
jgi:hypothetical protein